MNTVYDVIIVGTGAAGLFCALNFPETKKVCIITKGGLMSPKGFFRAQGGICMLRGEEDYEDYFEDTMRAGHYENNKKDSRSYDQIIESCYQRIDKAWS